MITKTHTSYEDDATGITMSVEEGDTVRVSFKTGSGGDSFMFKHSDPETVRQVITTILRLLDTAVPVKKPKTR